MQKNVDNIKKKERISYSVIKLYNDSFNFIFPIIILAIIGLFIFDRNFENIALLFVFAAAQIFFKITKDVKVVTEHQVCFHQVFIAIAAIISITYFSMYPSLKTVYYMLFVSGSATYLLIDFRTTLSYFLAYHIFLIIYSFYAVDLEFYHAFYALIYATPAIYVSRWLNQLIENSKNLEVSEKRYRLLFEQGNNAVLLLKIGESECPIISSNSYSEELFIKSKEEFYEKSFDTLLNLNEAETEEMCKRLHQLKSQSRLDGEYEFFKSNGEIFCGAASFVAIDLNDEKFIQVFIIDISEKKRNELALAETAQSFKNIVDNSQNNIFIFTENQLVYNNSHATEVFDAYLTKDKKDLFEIFPKKHQYLISELLGEVSNKVSSYNEIVLTKDSVEKRFSISMVKVVYKGANSILLNLTDITLQNEYNIQKIRAEIAEDSNKKLSEEIKNHKDTQQDLILKTSKLNALFESSNSLFILTIDRDLKISSFNTSFKDMMSYFLNVDVKINDDFLKTFPIEEEAYGKLIKKFKRALRGESVEIRSHFPTKKGTVWVESFISPVKVKGEPIKEIAFIAHNITEKVLNEKKVIDSEANNRATVSAIPDMIFKVNKDGYFTDFRLNEEGSELIENFAFKTDLKGEHIMDVFKNRKQARSFLINVGKSLKTGDVHTQNFIVPFIIGKTQKKSVYENRYARVNENEVIIITRDVTDKVEFETALIESVREKEVLLKEVHHRVKNNLQVISSILNLQSSYVEDEKTLEIINESQNRIRSMSYIHESLYQTKDFSSIDFHDYITNLVQNLVHSYQLYSGKTKLKLDIAKVQLILDQAIPCGLILNELVSNSLKHAYDEEEGGEIQIEITEADNKVTIRVEDFGSGLPEGFKIEDSDSLGLGLVDTLVDQIDGELILETSNGTKYLIIFEKQDL